MQKGNINAAIKLLTNNMQNGILPLNDETLSQLKQKHPEAKTACDAALLTDIPENIHPAKFENLDADMILKAAIKTKGGAGPSGMDADGWRRILVSNNFGKSNFDLRKAFAEVVKKLCIGKDQSSTLEAFLACRLIPLDKNPGLRPIGVGEVLRRIAGKAVVALVRNDIISSVGSLQVCAGHEAGCEAAIHAMHSIFQEQSTEAVLLVDASNAFNSVNRSVFLHNIAIICPAISTYVSNCYMMPSRLFVIGGYELKSSEGTTQGDPIAMAVYAMAVIPLLLMLLEIVTEVPDNTAKMVAYADDFTAAGTIKSLKKWWEALMMLGPKFGYHPQAVKSWLIVKSDHFSDAKHVFHASNIKITDSGKRHLGAVIGTTTFKNDFMNVKISQWIGELRTLIKVAETQPQAAYTCFISGFKHKFTYFMRTVPDISSLLQKVDDVITTELIPAITGGIICSSAERRLLSLPPKLGGLGIPILSSISDTEYQNSVKVTENLRNRIIQQERRYAHDVNESEIKNKIKSSRIQRNKHLLEEIRTVMNDQQRCLNDINREDGSSSWLTTIPLKDEGYILNKQLFWDLLRIRYGWAISRLPEKCSCGASFDLGRECRKVFSRLSEMIAEKRNQSRSIISSWIRRKINFSLMKSLGLCLRGSRSIFDKNIESSMVENAAVSELTSKIKV